MTNEKAPERIIVCMDGYKPVIAGWPKQMMKECDVEYVRADLTPASAAPVVDNDRSRCFSCKHEFCKECYEIGECCKCDTEIPPRTVSERLAQHEHIEVVDGVLGGVTPLVSRTRIGVHHIFTYLYNGNSIEYIAENYHLTPEAIKDAIAFAQDVYNDAVDLAFRTPAAATVAPVEQSELGLAQEQTPEESYAAFIQQAHHCRQAYERIRQPLPNPVKRLFAGEVPAADEGAR